MVEIYNEQIRDLLNKNKTPKGGLKVKERPEKGFYGKEYLHKINIKLKKESSNSNHTAKRVRTLQLS